MLQPTRKKIMDKKNNIRHRTLNYSNDDQTSQVNEKNNKLLI